MSLCLAPDTMCVAVFTYCSVKAEFESLSVHAAYLCVYGEWDGECMWMCVGFIRSLYREADGSDCFGTQLKKAALRTAKLSHLHTAGINDCAATCTQTNTH